MVPIKRQSCLEQACRFLIFVQILNFVLCAATNLNLRDGAPCQFWNGSVYFDDVCYKVVHTSSWYNGQDACKKDHHQALMAELKSIRPVYFLSLYSTYMQNLNPDPLYWLAAIARDPSGAAQWLTLTDTALLPPAALTGTQQGPSCLAMDTHDMTLKWMGCSSEGISTLCQIEVPLDYCPFPNATYHNGSCYSPGVGPLNHNKAKRECKTLVGLKKGYLAEIDSEEEFKFLALSSRIFMYEQNVNTVYVGAKRDSSSGNLQWITSKVEVNASTAHWWHQEELNPNSAYLDRDCLALTLKGNSSSPLLETIECSATAAYICEIDKWEERYIASVPLLKMDTDDLPGVTLIVSALNDDSQHAFMLVTYREADDDTSQVSTMLTNFIGKDNVFSYHISNPSDFISDPNIRTASFVITSDISFVVTLVYNFPGRSDKLFTSCALSPLGYSSAHYFIVTSTATCSGIPNVGNSTVVNPLVSNPNCACETFTLVVAVGTNGTTNITFEFPRETKLVFKAHGFEVQDPKTLKVELNVYESALIKSETDLSGTFIEASQDIIVYTGYTVKKRTPYSKCTSSLSIIQAKPVTEGDTIHHTAPYELSPPDGVTSFENYRVIALADNTEVTVNTSQGEEYGRIILYRTGEIREFSLPNTALYVIGSDLPVMVYRLSFSAPNKNTRNNDVITPCLVRLFSMNHSLRNEVEHVFPTLGIDYVHVVLRILVRDSSPLEGLMINDQPYNETTFSARDFPAPDVIMLRLDMGGLERIQLWKNNNGTSAQVMQYCAHACAGVIGSSGYCTELESRHSTKIRLSTKVDTNALASKDFHESPLPVVQYGFDSDEQIQTTLSPPDDTTQNEREIENVTTTIADLTEIPTEIQNATHQLCPVMVFTIEAIRLKVEEFKAEIKRRLYVDTRAISAFVRSKTSAEDRRPSSQTIGVVAVAFLCLTGFLVVLPDLITLLHWLVRGHAQ